MMMMRLVGFVIRMEIGIVLMMGSWLSFCADVVWREQRHHRVLAAPLAEEIDIHPMGDGMVEIAIPAAALRDARANFVRIMNLPTADEVFALLGEDQVARCTLFGAPGSTFQINSAMMNPDEWPEDVWQSLLQDGGLNLEHADPATRELLGGRLNGDPTSSPALLLAYEVEPPHAGAGLPFVRKCGPGLWAYGCFRGLDSSLKPGDAVEVQLDLHITTVEQDLTQVLTESPAFFFGLVCLFDEQGRQRSVSRRSASHVLTPTGMPIEAWGEITGVDRGDGSLQWGPGSYAQDMGWEPAESAIWSISGHTAMIQPSFVLHIPANLKPGLYGILERLNNIGTPEYDAGEPAGWDRFLHLFQVGQPAPPRLTCMLLGSNGEAGSRGILSFEDRDHVAVNFRNSAMPRRMVIPARDGYTHEPWPYALDPFLPLVSLIDRPAANVIPAPMIPFQMENSSLEVRVLGADGSQVVRGPHPLHHLQNDMSVLRPDWVHPGRRFAPVAPTYGNPSLCDTLHLSGDGAFDVTFEQDGFFEVVLEGEIHDVYGRRYEVRGHYPLAVAKPLDVEVFPELGTPLEPGVAFIPQVRVFPPMALDVECVWTHFPNSQASNAVTAVRSGRTNRFGLYVAADEPLLFDDPGEYVCDIHVQGEDQHGRLWAASRRGASVVITPDSPIRIHGERGNRADQQQWRARWFIAGDGRFITQPDTSKTAMDGLNLGHTCYPYESGDVAWLGDNIAFSLFPNATFEDPSGSFASELESRWPGVRQGEGREGIYPRHLLPEDRRAIGELPFVNMTGSGLPPSMAPDDIDWHGYFYTTSWRPGVSVRTQVSEDTLPAGYWFFDDPYGYQYGNGPAGDIAGDVKMNYVGAVLRDDVNGMNHYGWYASMLVLIDENDPLGPRVMPPFDGLLPGSPPGGELLRLGNQSYQVFITFAPTGPGAVLTTGQPVQLAGVVWPPVAGKVVGTVTLPDGRRHSFASPSNAMGVFDVTADVVDTPGQVDVEIQAVCSGATSVGVISEQVPQDQWPRGSGIGLTDGRFSLPVVSPHGEGIRFDLPEYSHADPSIPLRVQGHLPDGHMADQVHLCLSMPGQVMQQTTLAVNDGAFQYDYDPVAVAQEYPNLDTTIGLPAHGFDEFAPAWFDSVLLTFWAGSGEMITAGTVFLQGEVVFPSAITGAVASPSTAVAHPQPKPDADPSPPGLAAVEGSKAEPRTQRHSSRLLLDAGADLLFAAHPHSGEVVCMEVLGDQLVKRCAARQPGTVESIAFSASGDLWVAVSHVEPQPLTQKAGFGATSNLPLSKHSEIRLLDRHDLSVIRVLERPGRICAALDDRSGTTLFVTWFDGHAVLALDPVTGDRRNQEWALNRPSALASDDDDDRIFAVSFRTGEILTVDPDAMTHQTLDALSQLNQCVSLCIGEDGSVWAPQTRSDPILGGLTFDRTVFPVVAKWEPGESAVKPVLFPDLLVVPPHRPAEMVLDDEHLYLACAGSDDVLAVDRSTGFAAWHARDVGKEPGALALNARSGQLFLLTITGQEIVVLDAENGEALSRVRYTRDPTPPFIAHGRYLFGNATDPRITKDQWMSCASCHPEGAADGRPWDFGAGPLDTSTLAGSVATRPLHVTAHLDEIQDTYRFIRFAFAGQFFVDANLMSPYLSGTNAGLDRDLDALSAYIESLDRWTPPPVPQELKSGFETGQQLFFSAQTGCVNCHPPPYYTDSGTRNSDGSFKKYDVGTRLPEEGERHQFLDTPSLLGLGMTDPYLHDGRAATLQQVFQVWNTEDQHGITSHLNPEELDDLVTFLLYLR